MAARRQRAAAAAVTLAALLTVAGLGSAAAKTATECALAKVSADLPSNLGVLAVELPASLRDKPLTPDQLSVSWKRAARLGVVSVKLVVTSGNERRAYWARVRLGERARVLVAARPLKAGAAIARGDLVSEVQTLERDSGWRLAPAALIGATILADIDAGAQVEPTGVEAPAPVGRGETIAVEIVKGRVRVATSGVLERQARPGEVASVRLSATRKLIRVRLLSRRTAVMLETK